MRGTFEEPPTRLIPWFSKTEGNTYTTLLHHPFLFKENQRSAQEVARSKVDIITTYHVLNRWDYEIKAYTHNNLQHSYNNTKIHSNHHTEEQDPTTDEIKQKIRTTSTLLIPGSQPGTYPLIEEEELQKQSSMALMLDHRITYICNCCCSNL